MQATPYSVWADVRNRKIQLLNLQSLHSQTMGVGEWKLRGLIIVCGLILSLVLQHCHHRRKL